MNGLGGNTQAVAVTTNETKDTPQSSKKKPTLEKESIIFKGAKSEDDQCKQGECQSDDKRLFAVTAVNEDGEHGNEDLPFAFTLNLEFLSQVKEFTTTKGSLDEKKTEPLTTEEQKKIKIAVFEAVIREAYKQTNEELYLNHRRHAHYAGAVFAMASIFDIENEKFLTVSYVGDSEVVVIGKDQKSRWSPFRLVPIKHNFYNDDERDRVRALGGRVLNTNPPRLAHRDSSRDGLAPSRSFGDFICPGIAADPTIVTYPIKPENCTGVIVATDGYTRALAPTYPGGTEAEKHIHDKDASHFRENFSASFSSLRDALDDSTCIYYDFTGNTHPQNKEQAVARCFGVIDAHGVSRESTAKIRLLVRNIFSEKLKNIIENTVQLASIIKNAMEEIGGLKKSVQPKDISVKANEIFAQEQAGQDQKNDQRAISEAEAKQQREKKQAEEKEETEKQQRLLKQYLKLATDIQLKLQGVIGSLLPMLTGNFGGITLHTPDGIGEIGKVNDELKNVVNKIKLDSSIKHTDFNEHPFHQINDYVRRIGCVAGARLAKIVPVNESNGEPKVQFSWLERAEAKLHTYKRHPLVNELYAILVPLNESTSFWCSTNIVRSERISDRITASQDVCEKLKNFNQKLIEITAGKTNSKEGTRSSFSFIKS